MSRNLLGLLAILEKTAELLKRKQIFVFTKTNINSKVVEGTDPLQGTWASAGAHLVSFETMQHMRRQFLQRSHKLNNLLINDVMKAEAIPFKRCFGSISARTAEKEYESVTHDIIVPSISENDTAGSLAFRYSSWRDNANWRSQFDTCPLQTNNIERGLFGNLVLDVQTPHKQLNQLLFNTRGTKYFKIQDTR